MAAPAEKLRERHGIDLARETVRRIMVDAGFWVPRRQRPPKVRQPCNRRACLGELVQIDGSDHRWFEDRAPACRATAALMNALGKDGKRTSQEVTELIGISAGHHPKTRVDAWGGYPGKLRRNQRDPR